jgi:hypothetical protein
MHDASCIISREIVKPRLNSVDVALSSEPHKSLYL